MDSVNSEMTGEPNQLNRPTVFAFNPYQQPGIDSSWEKFQVAQMAHSGSPYQNPPGSPYISNVPIQQVPQVQLQTQTLPQHQSPFEAQQFLGNFTPPVTPSVSSNYGAPCPIPGSFSFGSPESRPTSFPVQFPFTVSSTSMGSSPAPGPSGSSTSGGAFGTNIEETFPSAGEKSITRMGIGISQSTSISGEKSRGIFMLCRGKRKNDDPSLQPTKQHITEEIMAQHMSNLHISSETAVPDETEMKREKRLYMCAEMRKLRNESIIPESLMNKLNRPCTALVLWTPPPRIFPSLSSSTDENQNDQSDEMESQNTVTKSIPLEPEPEEIELEVDNVVVNEMDYDL